MECGNMSEEDYKASLEVEYAEEQAYEFQLRRDGIVAFLDILGSLASHSLTAFAMG